MMEDLSGDPSHAGDAAKSSQELRAFVKNTDGPQAN